MKALTFGYVVQSSGDHSAMATVWSCGLIAQTIMLLTLAFAIGAGWWAGFVAFVAIGVVIGMVFRLSGVYWAVQIALWVLLVLISLPLAPARPA